MTPDMTPDKSLERGSPAATGAIPSRRRVLTPYVAAWALIGLLASAYIAALALRPELVSEYLPVFRPGEPEGNQGQRAMSKALAELQGVRQSVSQVQLDVAKIRTDLSGDQQRTSALTARLALLEERVASGIAAPPPVAGAAPARAPAPVAAVTPPVAPAAPSKAAAAASATPSPDAAAGAGPRTDQRIETGSIGASAAALVPKVINAPADTPQTQVTAAPAQVPAARVAAAPAARPAIPPAPAAAAPRSDIDPESTDLVTFGPAVVKPAPEPIGLRISNGPSLDALRLSWSLLADRHAAQLRNLEARYLIRAPDGDGDGSFDLVAGPVKSQAEAKKLCKALAAKNIPCQIGTFGGNQL